MIYRVEDFKMTFTVKFLEKKRKIRKVSNQKKSFFQIK